MPYHVLDYVSKALNQQKKALNGAKVLADAKAAKAAGVQHVVWSTLEDTRKWVPLSDNRMPTLMGKYKVPHFDAKAEADVYFSGLPVTYLVTSFYWDNLYAFGLGPKKGEDGVYSWAFPMGNKRLAGIAVEDTPDGPKWEKS